MYQALYRKYRPNTLDEIAGQEPIVKTLKNAIMQQKVTHAYLFTGPRGTGKTSIAKILAKTINCQNPKDGLPCENCDSCLQISQHSSTDIIEIDAASNNGVDEIRELKSKVNLVPSNSKYKVYIIDEVHMLTVGAFNALLKTLEEPPAHIIFILATTEPHKIPATILSRCQRFDFKRIGQDQLIDRLKYIAATETIAIEDEAIIEIARLSDGGLRDSIGMLDQACSYAEGTITMEDVHEINGTITPYQLKDFVVSLFHQDLETVFTLLDQYNDKGKNLTKMAEELLLLFRTILFQKKTPQYVKNHILNPEMYQELSNMIGEVELLNIMKILNNSLSDMKTTNYPKMVIELAIVQMMNQDKTVENTKDSNVSVEKTQSIVSPSPSEQAIVKTPSKQPNSKEESPAIVSKPPSIVPTLPRTNRTEPVESELDEKEKLQLQEIKQVRINNTLAEFSKRTLLEMKAKMDVVHSMILNPEYSRHASLVLDGELKAASPTNLIVVYDTQSLADLFNQSLLPIQKMFDELYSQSFILIAVSSGEWDSIKTEFNSKQKEYHLLEETVDIEKLLTPKKIEIKDDMKELFGDIVEYQA